MLSALTCGMLSYVKSFLYVFKRNKATEGNSGMKAQTIYILVTLTSYQLLNRVIGSNTDASSCLSLLWVVELTGKQGTCLKQVAMTSSSNREQSSSQHCCSFTCNCLHPPLEKEPSNNCYYRLLSPYMNQHDIALHTRDDMSLSLSLFWSLVLPLF